MYAGRNEGHEVVLTSDRGSFSEYSRSSALGYFCCLPSRLVPRAFMDWFFAPPMRADANGIAVTAPYALRKVEAALLANGISDVVVAPPETLDQVVGRRTRVVGVTAHDPFGFAPVTTKLTMLFGGSRSWNEVYFDELGATLRRLRSTYGFRIVAGGPGIWQASLRRPEWVDTVFQGEAERTFPDLVRSLIAGLPAPAVLHGQPPALEEIPVIARAARVGEVQVTRGCPRGCEFCSITPDRYRTIPWEAIAAEIRVNQAAGERNVELITDDILLYGAKKLRTNHEAVVDLFTRLKAAGAEQIGFAHISAPAVKESPATVRAIGEIAEYERTRGLTPVVGLETGSVRIFQKYMPAKAFPYKPKEWKDVILDATVVLNDSGIDPCYTMTIGFPDETDADVDESIALVQALIDQGSRAFIFPLPVIPISTSRIRGNPMPHLASLPARYWDLLALAWKHDLALAQAMLPTFVSRMNPLARSLTAVLVQRLSRPLEKVFDEFQSTRGTVAQEYARIHVDGLRGVMKALAWVGRTITAGRLPSAPSTGGSRFPG